jgi:hypothetical protein
VLITLGRRLDLLRVQVDFHALLSVLQRYMELMRNMKANFLLLQGLDLVALAEAYMVALLSGKKVILTLKNLRTLIK